VLNRLRQHERIQGVITSLAQDQKLRCEEERTPLALRLQRFCERGIDLSGSYCRDPGEQVGYPSYCGRKGDGQTEQPLSILTAFLNHGAITFLASRD
jgi:hypothetical protein